MTTHDCHACGGDGFTTDGPVCSPCSGSGTESDQLSLRSRPRFTDDSSHVVSVWSAYGHRFIHEDGAEHCLTCGAVYVLRAIVGDPTRGEYQCNDGSEPAECTHDTSMTHGLESPSDESCPCCACSG